MSIRFVTGVSSHELEDRIIETLTAHDFSLLGRVHSKVQLRREIEKLSAKNPSDLRVLIVLDQSISPSPSEKIGIKSEEITFVEVDFHQSFDAERFLSCVYEKLRSAEQKLTASEVSQRRALTPRFLAEQFSSEQSGPNRGGLIGFTGSSTSPGITTLAINVAAELSLKSSTTLIDADPLRSDIGVRLGLKSRDHHSTLNKNLNLVDISTLYTSATVDALNEAFEQLKIVINKSQIGCIDLGKAPDLKTAISDRRAPGRAYIENLQMCNQLVYVLNPESHCLNEMQLFAEQIQDFYPSAKLTVVLNKTANSSRQQGLKRSFRSRVNDLQLSVKHFLIPADPALMERAQGRYSTLNEIAPRSSLRKTCRELSIYLHNPS